jgi:hypothetical protein
LRCRSRWRVLTGNIANGFILWSEKTRPRSALEGTRAFWWELTRIGSRFIVALALALILMAAAGIGRWLGWW